MIRAIFYETFEFVVILTALITIFKNVVNSTHAGSLTVNNVRYNNDS